LESSKTNMGIKYPVQTLEKALEVISIMKDGPYDGMRLKDLSEKLGLGKSTVHRILKTLVAYGYVEQPAESKKYRLGWKFFEVGSVIPRQRNLNNMDLKVLWELCEKYEETVNLGIRIYNKVAIIAKVDPQKVLFKAGPYLGEHEPLHATALGKVLLSDLEDNEITKIIGNNSYEKYTDNTVANFEQLKEQLNQVRENGYAVDREELTVGLTCIAMPVYNYNNEIIAGLSVSGPTFRLYPDKVLNCKEGLKKSCEELSVFFGSINGQQTS